jgi:hypothetical protein
MSNEKFPYPHDPFDPFELAQSGVPSPRDREPMSAGGRILPDGSMCDWLATELSASFSVHPFTHTVSWDPFSACCGMPMPGDPSSTVGFADASMPRPGHNGLPRDYEMLVYRWRASTALTMSDELRRFAATVNAEIIYNEKSYDRLSLLDLLDTPAGWPASLAGIDQQDASSDAYLAGMLRGRSDSHHLPIHLREHLGYRVPLLAENEVELDRFKRWLLRGQTARADKLRLLAKIAKEVAVADELRALADEESPPSAAVFKIHLEGLQKRPLF